MSDKLKSAELEMLFEIWLHDGCHYEVGPDRDGFECIELRFYTEDDVLEEGSRFLFDYESAKCLHTALEKLIVLHAEKESVKLDNRE